MRIVLDVDGVLADFCGGALEVINRIYDREGLAYFQEYFAAHAHASANTPPRGGNVRPYVRRSDVKQWEMENLLPEKFHPEFFEACGAQGFCAHLKPLPGAQAAVAFLQSLPDVKLVIATSPWRCATWIPEREMWLHAHFPGAFEEIHHVKDKTGVRGDVFVDDKPEHVRDWFYAHRAVGTRALLWDAPYNQDAKGVGWYGARVRDWLDVMAHVNGAYRAR